jgi:ubiquinone/menaquinone biosynthesis C-methylase UbiE
MPQFHFVQDYEALIAQLMAEYPLDEAMSRAVGGRYEEVGQIECAALRYLGLTDGMALIDLGCGSGRLAWALGRQRMRLAAYTGIDIIQALLDYARARAPRGYQFVLHRDLSIPAPDASADMVAAFSVFTHLLHLESFLYMRDIFRVLRPGGLLVFSFLEFAQPGHWEMFANSADAHRAGMLPHLNEFIERDVIELWSAKLGFHRERFIDASAAPWAEAGPLGQSIAVLRRP